MFKKIVAKWKTLITIIQIQNLLVLQLLQTFWAFLWYFWWFQYIFILWKFYSALLFVSFFLNSFETGNPFPVEYSTENIQCFQNKENMYNDPIIKPKDLKKSNQIKPGRKSWSHYFKRFCYQSRDHLKHGNCSTSSWYSPKSNFIQTKGPQREAPWNRYLKSNLDKL